MSVFKWVNGQESEIKTETKLKSQAHAVVGRKGCGKSDHWGRVAGHVGMGRKAGGT